MKKSTNNIIIEFLGLIIGCMFMGVGLNMFFKPYTIAPGGLSGLSLVISKFTGLSVSTIMLLIGIPLLVSSIKILGKKDAIKTFIGMVILSGILEIVNVAGNVVIVSDYLFSDSIQYDCYTENFRKEIGVVNRKLAKIADTVVECSYGNIIYHKGKVI